MDEQEYKDIYDRINQLRCVFEKAMCSLTCNCSRGTMFRLADRHGFGCQSPLAQKRCVAFLDHMRAQTRFVFKLRDIEGPLPHNKEIRVQNGGLLGVQKMLGSESERVDDVSELVGRAIDHYGSVEQVPFDRVVQSIMAYQARPRRRSRRPRRSE